MDKIFEKALEWYMSGNFERKKMACELFPEIQLKDRMEEYEEEKRIKKEKEREEQLQKNLERCKELFPIGTPVWSDDGTDNCPNIIVSEPYIEETKYREPYGAYDLLYKGPKKSIFAKTIRVPHNEPLEGRWKNNVVCLEKCLYAMDSESPYCHREHIIDFEDFYKKQNEERTNRIKRLKENIERVEKDLSQYKDELEDFEKYNPLDFNQEFINKIVKDYA